MLEISWLAIALTIAAASTPLLLAAAGELVVERAGVLNLGLEGMMLMGAVIGFIVKVESGSWFVACLAAACVGALFSQAFAFFVLTLRANQVAAGLALTILGGGLAAVLGAGYVGVSLAPMPRIPVVGSELHPWLGLLEHSPLFWLGLLVVVGVQWFLFHSRAGLVLRAVGDSHDSAHALGYSVLKVRALAIAFGGAMAGLGGAYLSLVHTPLWSEGMTAGRGWIALALVVFAFWRPWRLLFGTFFFASVTILEIYAQGFSLAVPPQFFAMLPYLATIVILVFLSSAYWRGRSDAPAALGKTFAPPY